MEQMVDTYLKSMTNITPSDDQIEAIEEIREYYKEVVIEIFALIPQSRERSIALTELETSLMWAVKAIVMH